jgi:hypothetical protein
MRSFVYDIGALLAAERRDQFMWGLHEHALASGARPIVPAAVLAQAWRGGPQHNLSRLLRGCQILPDAEDMGRAAGTLCGKAGTSDVVDALVAVTALHAHAPIVTSDPADLNHLASCIPAKLDLHTV